MSCTKSYVYHLAASAWTAATHTGTTVPAHSRRTLDRL